ncbi:MAG: acyltransferase [Pseudomonadota bacterium]
MTYRSLQGLRAVAVLMVVLLHVALTEVRFANGAAIDFRLGEIGGAGVDLFFVLSGFIMMHVTRGLAGGAQGAARFAAARALRIYPLHWVVSLPLLAVFVAAPDLINASQAAAPNLVASFLLLPAEGLPLNPVAWTLEHEMYFYLVFALVLVAAPGRWRLPALCAWMFAVVAGSIAYGPGAPPALQLLFHPLSAEFFLGAVAGALAERAPPRGRLIFAIGLALFLAALVWRAVFDPDAMFPVRWERVLLFGPGATLMVLGAAVAESSGRGLPNPAWTVRLGDASYAIYLAHVPAIVAVGRLWAPVDGPGLSDNVAAVLAMTAAGVGAGYAAHVLVERRLLRAARALRDLLDVRLSGRQSA